MARISTAEYDVETDKFTLSFSTGGYRVPITWKEARRLSPRYRGEDPLLMELCLKNKNYVPPKSEEESKMANILQIKFKAFEEDNYIPVKHRVKKALIEFRENNPNFEKITKDPGLWKVVDPKGGMAKIPVKPKEARELHNDPEAWDQLEVEIADVVKNVNGIESFDDVLCDWMKD